MRWKGLRPSSTREGKKDKQIINKMKTIKSNLGDLFIWFGNLPDREKITIGGAIPGILYTIM